MAYTPGPLEYLLHLLPIFENGHVEWSVVFLLVDGKSGLQRSLDHASGTTPD
jgi:hypothetical protein